MSEAKSSSVSLDIYSSCIQNCKNIYPHKLVRPLGKFKLDHKSILKDVVDDILVNNFRITQYIADNPKRATAKGCLCHSSWHPCEYCYARGVKLEVIDNQKIKKKLTDQIDLVQEKITDLNDLPNSEERRRKIENLVSLKNELQKSINSLKQKTNILWPFSTMKCEQRTRRTVLQILDRIENGEILSSEESKGIYDRSILLDIPEFDYVFDVPCEYLHCGCLGVVKRLVSLTFNLGESRKRNTKRKLSQPALFNKLMAMTKVVKEFSRRARDLNLAVFKGQEYRNIAIFFFPLVLECIEPEAKERHLWLYLAYILRSALIPSEEYWAVNISDVEQCCSKYYETYEKLMGKRNCTYNLHTFCSHLTKIRTHGPLTKTSAFKFESFYGEVRRSFVPGTTSTTKQILRNIYMKRAISSHCCENSIFISDYETPMECNNLVYCYNRNEYKFFKVIKIDDETLICNPIGVYPAVFPETPNLDWSKVGVFERGGICSEEVKIKTADTCGKVLYVGKYLITCPDNILREK